MSAYTRFTMRLTAALCVALLSTTASRAQEAIVEPTVTSVSAGNAATFTPTGGGEPAPVTIGMPLSHERVNVAADGQIMIYSPSGRGVVVVKGPASFAVRLGDTKLTFHLLSGRLAATS